MQFGHERLDVYRVSIRYVAWAYQAAKRLNGIDRHARDQLLRIVSMLTKLGQRRHEVRESPERYDRLDYDNDNDNDNDNDSVNDETTTTTRTTTTAVVIPDG